MDDATADTFAANEATEQPIDDEQFHDLVRGRIRPLLELAHRLTAICGGELALTRPLSGRLLLESGRMEELLDEYGASHNRRWSRFRALTATLRNFARIGQGLAHLIGGLLPLLTNLILSLDAGLGHGFFIECLQDRFRVRLIRLRAGLNALTLQVTQGHGLGALDVCHLERAGLELDLFKHLARGLDAGLVLEKRVFVGLDGFVNRSGVLFGAVDQLLLNVLGKLLRLGELFDSRSVFLDPALESPAGVALEKQVQIFEVVGINAGIFGVDLVQ